jgi:hypothetical protein
MNTTTIKHFKNYINHTIQKISEEINTNKNNLVKFKDVIYYSSLINGNNWSFSLVNSHLKIKKILDVTKKTIIIEKNKIHFKYFKRLNDSIQKYIYNKSKGSILAIDGTYINLFKSLCEDSFKISKNRHYCSVLINTLFDVEKEIPINYYLYKKNNERKALEKQFKYRQTS